MTTQRQDFQTSHLYETTSELLRKVAKQEPITQQDRAMASILSTVVNRRRRVVTRSKK